MLQAVIKTEDQVVQEFLIGLDRKVDDLSPVMRNFGEYMERSISKNFREGGRPDKWKPSQRALSTGGKTLILTRWLQNSVTYKAEKDRISLGTNVIYGGIHQKGGKAGRGKKVTIPARPYLVFQNDDIEYLFDAILRHITRQ